MIGREIFVLCTHSSTAMIQGVCVPHTTPQQTQNICITFVQRRPNVFDVGPTLYKCYANVLCLLGSWLTRCSAGQRQCDGPGVVRVSKSEFSFKETKMFPFCSHGKIKAEAKA